MDRIDLFMRTVQPDECALVLSEISRHYLSSFSSSDGALLVLSHKAYLFLDSRYLEMAQRAKEAGKISPSIEILSAPFHTFLAEKIKENPRLTLLVEDRELTVSQVENLKKRFPETAFSFLGDRIEKMRVQKTEEEIEKIRASQALAEEAYLYILSRITAGRYEREIAAELEFYMKKNGASAPSFETICVSGTRSALPHGRPEGRIEQNSFVTLDFGAVLDGYASDMTRIVCVGRADEEMRRVYETVKEAQEAGVLAVKAGVSGKTVDNAAREVIKKAGYGEYFGHATGHGIGLCVHEAPTFSPKEEEIIPSGAVLSVEPGIYLPGKFGVRIEDLVVVREGKCENLNKSAKDLIEL